MLSRLRGNPCTCPDLPSSPTPCHSHRLLSCSISCLPGLRAGAQTHARGWGSVPDPLVWDYIQVTSYIPGLKLFAESLWRLPQMCCCPLWSLALSPLFVVFRTTLKSRLFSHKQVRPGIMDGVV